jgi:hypothetical protein
LTTIKTVAEGMHYQAAKWKTKARGQNARFARQHEQQAMNRPSNVVPRPSCGIVQPNAAVKRRRP